jgi:hypothetical protein
LSEHPPEGLPPVAELAELIKALREANTVEAATERTGTRKAARAEHPVTARIRERMAEEPVQVAPGPATVEGKPEPVQKPEEPPASPPAAVNAMPEPVRLVDGYRQSVTRRTQANEASCGCLDGPLSRFADTSSPIEVSLRRSRPGAVLPCPNDHRPLGFA